MTEKDSTSCSALADAVRQWARVGARLEFSEYGQDGAISVSLRTKDSKVTYGYVIVSAGAEVTPERLLKIITCLAANNLKEWI